MEEPVSARQLFHASKQSQLGRARTGIRIGMAVALLAAVLVAVLAGGGSLGVPAVMAGIMLLVLLPFDRYLGRQMRPGRALVVLDDQAIESPKLSGKAHRLAWPDIERLSVESMQGTPCLRFHLKAAPARGGRLGRAKTPTLVLSPLAAEDQERLIDAVNRRLGGAVTNALRERREFQERLKALAPHAWATYGLIAANVLVWLAMLGQGASFLQTPADQLLRWGGNAASEVQRGEWWRLLTATFLHGGFMHVAMNMLGLLGAGILVERIYGIRLFLLVYFGSGLLGGGLIAYILPERFDMAHFRRHYFRRAVLALAAAGAATAGLAAMAPRAAVDQARVLASLPLMEQGFQRFDAAIKAFREEQAALRAGRLDARAVDERNRVVHAPAFRQVAGDLARVTLRPADPRGPLLQDARRMSELLAESLGMASVWLPGNPQPQPADPIRMARIETELEAVAASMKTHMDALGRAP